MGQPRKGRMELVAVLLPLMMAGATGQEMWASSQVEEIKETDSPPQKKQSSQH